jgi:integrase
MALTYRAERAISAEHASTSWVVVSGDFEFHSEGCAFLANLRGRDRSPNTERLYAGRVALFLSWCAGDGVDWKQPRLDQLVRFKRWLIAEPRSSIRSAAGRSRPRSPATADAILGTVSEFYRFCAHHDLVDPAVLGRFYEPRYLRFLPPGYEPGEDNQFRTVRSRTLRFAIAETPFEFIEPERVEELISAAGNPRDRFLVALVATTGLRVGEALGLHRHDMHLLADSGSLGCTVAGPHLHVRRRMSNPNGALAKSRFPRSIPVPEEAISLYADYAHERFERLGVDESSPLVFVNLYRPPLGAGMRYHNVRELFTRLTRATGLTARPHLLRHTAATTWLRQGTPRDTVQQLLGHVSPSSMQPYVHPSEADKREAVERGAAWARSRR